MKLHRLFCSLFSLVLAAPLAAASPVSAQDGAVQRMVTITLQRPAGVADLLERDFDVIFSHPAEEGGASQRFDVIVTDEELARLRRLEADVVVVHQDLAGFYEQRLLTPEEDAATESGSSLGAWLSPPFGQGSMGGYYTWAEVTSVLDQIAAAYPAIVRGRQSIGSSLQGRGIWNVKVSDNPTVDENEPEVRFDAMHHCREPQGMQATLWTLLWLVENYGTDARATWIVDNREIWFLPVINPDGYVFNQSTNPGGGGLWRKNRRDNGDGTFGVDLNRNYDFQWGVDNLGSSPSTSSETYRGPAPASEPEVQALAAFMASRNFDTALSTHTFSNLWLAPWGYTDSLPANNATYDEIGAHATEINGYEFGPASTVLYFANGVTVDYDQGVHGTLSWTPEIGSSSDGFWPPQSRIVPLAEENLEAFLRTALAAGSYARVFDVTTTDTGDGDGFYEPGETFELVVTVRNGGLLGTTGGVDLQLTSADASLSLGTTNASLGNLNAFTSGSNAATPLTFTVDAAAVPGTQASFSIDLTGDGLPESVPFQIAIGEPSLFLRDDLEDVLGWQAGLPGDTATTGIWEYGDPVGTTNSGVPSNPENDASVVGVNCFTTGNGSTSAGGDDVDNGFTTLISPRIDLSGVGSAIVSYARWYISSTGDDPFEVSISDDDGATWVPLETVNGTANSWTRVEFFVADFVSLTDQVRLRFVASDDPNNSVTEAAVDDLQVQVFDADPRFNIFGLTAIGTDLSLNVNGPAGAAYGIFEASGTGLFNFALINGPLLLDPVTLALLFDGTLPANGLAQTVATIPNDPTLVGVTLYYQALVSGTGGLFLTNRDQIDFE